MTRQHLIKRHHAGYPRKSHSKLDELQWHSIGEPQMRNNCLPFITKIPDTKTVYFQANGRRDGKMSSATTTLLREDFCLVWHRSFNFSSNEKLNEWSLLERES